jgi:hypothetical protein
MATVPIGGEDYEAFADVAFADNYLAADVLRAGPWATRNADAKGRGLVSATRMLLTLPWCEDVPDPTVEQDSPIPEVTAELAADLLAKPRLFADASGNTNVKSAKAGSAQVEFFSPVEGGPPIPKALWDKLLAAGLVCLGTDEVTINDAPYASGLCGGYRPTYGRFPWDWPIACEDYD